jgi:hypothetical protein
METIGRARGREPDHAAGAAIEIPVDITVYDREARYRGPDYPETAERALIASPAPGSDDGRFRFLIDDTSEAGLGRLRLRRRGGEEEWKGLSIRSEPEESDLSRTSAAKIAALYPDAPLRVVRDTAGFSEAGKGRFEIADLLMGLFIALLFIEGLLACRFARHRRAGVRAAAPPGGRP